MIIRNARSTEVQIITNIGVIAWEQAFLNAGENTSALKQNADAIYHRFCSHFWPLVKIVERDNQIVAWGALEAAHNKLTDLWVLPKFQRNGVGSALLEALERQVFAYEFTEIKLDTHAKNNFAVSFFKKHGFMVSGLTSIYSEVLDKSVDTLQMKKRLK